MLNSMNDYSQHYDSQYEQSVFARHDSIHTVECEHCKGAGKIVYSNCCGSEVLDGICQDIECLKPCIIDQEKCYDCNGEGEVEI